MARERGGAPYFLESGRADVFRDGGDTPVARLADAISSRRRPPCLYVRQATCVAATDAKCLAPLREDFVGILGNLQNLLD